jgi:hypothetical protein
MNVVDKHPVVCLQQRDACLPASMMAYSPNT